MGMTAKINSRVWITGESPGLFKLIQQKFTIPNPAYVKAIKFGGWVDPKTPKTIALYRLVDDYIVLPYGCLHDLYEMCPECEIIMDLPEYKTVPRLKTQDMHLYDYQQEAVDHMSKTVCGILQAPAGSGKTQMGIALAITHRVKTLWITHTLDLVEQSRIRASQFINPDDLGVIGNGKCKIGRFMTFATVQTLSKMDLDELKHEWGCIIVDECHRVAGTDLKMTQFSKCLNRLAAKYKYGLSATVHRSDGLVACTFAMLGHIVHEVPVKTVADRIMDVKVAPIALDTPESDAYLGTDGMINWTQYVNYLVSIPERNAEIVRRLIADKNHSCLILSDRVEHLQTLMEMLPEQLRKKAVMVKASSSTKNKKDRLKAFEDMRSGKKKYLFATFMLAKEGLDIPILDRLYMVIPHQDYAILIQSIGRIARIYPGKEQPIAYDFVDVKEPGFSKYLKRCIIYRKNKIGLIEVK